MQELRLFVRGLVRVNDGRFELSASAGEAVLESVATVVKEKLGDTLDLGDPLLSVEVHTVSKLNIEDELLKELRRILRTPEGVSIVEHAKGIMSKVRN